MMSKYKSSFSQAKKLIKATAKNLKSIAKSTRIREYAKARRRLERSIKTGKKYGSETVALPDKPKRITQGSINRLNKLNEQQKRYNKKIAKYKTVKIKYYYKDKETGKRIEVANQEISLDEAVSFNRKSIQVKDFASFMENAKRLNTMEKIHDIGELIRVATHDTDSVMAKGGEGKGTSLFGIYNEHSLLGDGSPRQVEQANTMKNAISDIMGAVKDGKITPEVQNMVNDVIALYEEYRTYYHDDDEMDAIEIEIAQKIAVIELSIHGGNPDTPLEARTAEMLTKYGDIPFKKTVGKDPYKI